MQFNIKIRKLQIGTLKDETKPVGLEEHAVRNQIEPMLRSILAFLIGHIFKGGTELVFFTPYHSKSTNKSISTLSNIIKRVLLQNYEFKYRHLSNLLAFWHSRTIKIPKKKNPNSESLSRHQQ